MTNTDTANHIDAFLSLMADRAAATAEVRAAVEAADDRDENADRDARAATFAEVLARIGDRKFTVEDVTPGLAAAATHYARSYTGTFDYMVDMRAAATSRRGLSTGQAKGVLNCMRAQASRDAETAQAAVEVAEKVAAGAVPAAEPGYYLLAGEVINLVRTRDGQRTYGKRFVPGQHGERGRWVYAPGTAQRLTTADWLTIEQAAEYGHLNDRCFKCQARLDDPTSVALGIGPVCIVKVYGEAGKARVKETRKAIKLAGTATPAPALV